MSIAARIGYRAHTLNHRVKKRIIGSGMRADIPTEQNQRLKALARENSALRKAVDMPAARAACSA